MSPTEASDPKYSSQVWLNLNKTETKIKPKKIFAVGDHVRISRLKGTFEKGHAHNWTYEVFTVSKVLDTDPVTYKLIDYNKDQIEGSFYSQELQKTDTGDYYEVEKILDTRKVGKKKEYLVKFYGWSDKFSEWLPEDQVKDIL